MQCPHCEEELTIIEGELSDSHAELIGATDVNISVTFDLTCESCGEDLGSFEFNNDQDIGDFVEEHGDYELNIELYEEDFCVLKSNGHVSVGVEATLRVVCEGCSVSTDYKWSDYVPLNEALDGMV